MARDGSLWIGYGELGRAVRLRQGQSRIYGEPEGLPRAALTALVEDPDGHIWAATGRGLYGLAEEKNEEKWIRAGADDGLPDGQAYSIKFNSRRDMIVGTGSGVFRRSGASRFEPMASLHEGLPRSITEDAEGRLYITDSVVGFRPLDNVPSSSDDPLRRGRGYAVLHDSQDNLWVGTLGQGLWRVRRRGADYAIERTIELTGLSSDGVLTLMEDRDGNLWAGTSEGLNRLVPRRIIRVTDLGLVTGVEPGVDGDLWVSTVDDLMRFSAANTESPIARVRLPGSRMRTMYANRGGLWAVTDRGIYKLDSGRTSLVAVAGTASLRQVGALTADSNGTLWLYDEGHALYSLRGGALKEFELPDDRRTDRIALMYTDTRDRLWIAFASGQLGQIVSGTFQLHDGSSGYAPGNIQAIYEDQDSVIWFARTDGLARFADGRFTLLSRQAGFPLSLTAIAEDKERDLWVGSTLGIARIARAELQKAVASSDAHVQYTLFGRSDGIAGTPQSFYSLGRPVARAADGRLWFVTGSGMTVIDPQALAAVGPPSPVRVERVVANDTTMLPAPGLRLPPRSSRLQFDYTVVNLTSPLRTHFRYRLEGFDADWVDAGTRRQAYYTNLPPKPYRFRVGGEQQRRHVDRCRKPPGSSRSSRCSTRRAGSRRRSCALVALAGWGAWRLRLRQVRQRVLAAPRRTDAPEPRDPRHAAAEPGRRGAAVRCARRRAAGIGRTHAGSAASGCAGRSRSTSARRVSRSGTCARPRCAAATSAARCARSRSRRSASTAMAVDVDVTGAPPRRVPRVEEQLLRIGQEAITNAVRHAGAKPDPHRPANTVRTTSCSVSPTTAAASIRGATQSEPNGHYGLIDHEGARRRNRRHAASSSRARRPQAPRSERPCRSRRGSRNRSMSSA